MSGRVVLFVSAPGAPPPAWTPAWGELRAVDRHELRGAVAKGDADVALVEATSVDPIPVVREVHACDPTLQPVLIAPDGERARIERALLFATGVGETWVRTGPDSDVIEQAAAVTRQRRSYRLLQQQLSAFAHSDHAPAPRPLVSDAYLAALLQVLADPAIAVDADGRVVYWSSAAAEMLQVPTARALGRGLPELLDSTADWPGLLARSAHEPTRAEIQLRRAGGDERTVAVALSPIVLPRKAGRAVLLHDLTAERHALEQVETQAQELESQAAEMEAQAAELQQIAAEREELLAERERTLRDLRRAMEVRTRFYASMNHEIRTPINAILGYTDLLVSGTYGEMQPQQLKALQQSQRAARHLIEIVNDLLDLSKLEAGRMDLQISPVNVPELLEDLKATTAPLAAEHGSALRIEANSCAPPLITDARRVRQVLLNLVSNAVKFGEGKPITMRCAQAGEGVAIEVQDEGIGIALEDQPAIFDEFVQVGNDSNGGTGLGLPISRRLAGLLGGALTVQSRPGEGSTFRLELPARPPGMARPTAG